MPETAQQYIARIHSYLGDGDPLSVLASTPNKLRTMLSTTPAGVLDTRPEPKKWSILEQVVHLSDVEVAVGYRIRAILGAEDGIPIQAFDQDAWLAGMDYASRKLEPTLTAFAAARENNISLYRSLSEAAWNKYGMHAERGKETIRDIVRLQGGHDLNHIRQIEAILATSTAAASGR